MSDYLTHLATTGLNQSQGFQFRAGELRPRLASHFEPIGPIFQENTLLESMEEIVEAEPANGTSATASAKSRSFDSNLPAKSSGPSIESEALSHRAGEPITHRRPETLSAERQSPEQSVSESSGDSVPVLGDASTIEAPVSMRVAAARSTILRRPIAARASPLDRASSSAATGAMQPEAPQRGRTEVTSHLHIGTRLVQSPAMAAPRDGVVEPAVESTSEARIDGDLEGTQHGSSQRRTLHGVIPDILHTDQQPAGLPDAPLSNRMRTIGALISGQRKSSSERRESLPDEVERSTAPTINVTIGRVEVRAVAAPSAPASRSRAAPVMTLEEYLRRRTSGGGA